MLMFREIDSPVGRLRLVASTRGLVAVLWENDPEVRTRLGALKPGEGVILDEAERQLRAYFAGRLRAFDLPLDARGTEFQKSVWSELARIPYGETRSYGELALRLGNPTASRAVGAANGRNPLSIVIPCHRVIGASGKLTGFAGGLEAKRVLLALERQTPLDLGTGRVTEFEDVGVPIG